MAVNLAVDRVSPIVLARLSDVSFAIVARPYGYDLAARAIGLSPAEYAEFRRSLQSRDAAYVPLPRHIDAMSGRRKDGHVYVLRQVLVPAMTMGWVVPLLDGTIVYVPRACGNLSMSRGKPVAHHPHFFVNVSYHGYFTPVTFAPPIVPSAPPGSSSVPSTEAPDASAPPVASAKTGSSFGFFAPLFAPIAAFFSGSTPSAPPCSAGSNDAGSCRP